MKEKTGHDLSHFTMILDYSLLLDTVQDAVYLRERDINDTMKKIRDEFNKPILSPMPYILSEQLPFKVKRFDSAIRCLHTLQHGTNREIKEFVNIPEIELDENGDILKIKS